MTICPRCGLPNRPGTSACQRCGTQLTAMPPGAALPNAGDANDGLPEWLRPLQPGAIGSPLPGSNPLPPSPMPHNPPAPYGYNQPGYNQSGGPSGGFGPPPQQGQPWQQAQQGPQQQFSMGSLVSEDALPEWLRQANPGVAPQSQPAPGGWGAPAGPPPAAQPRYGGVGAPRIPAAPSSYGAPGPGGQYGYGAPAAPGYGMGSVPPSQPLLSSPYGQIPPAGPLAGAINPGTPASTLFDESALPDWMRQAGAQSGGVPANPYQQPPQAAAPYQQLSGGPGTGYSGYQAQGYQPPAQPVPQPPSNAFPSIDRAGAFQPAPQPQGGMAAQSLLDSGALSHWLGGQSGPPAQGGYGGGGAAPSSGMAAQSLVDESALPQWLRAQPDAPTPAAPAAPAFGAPAPAPAQPGGWNAAPAAEEPLPAWLNQVYTDAKVPRTDTLQQQASANPWGANGGYRSSVSGPLSGGFGAGRMSGAPRSEANGVSASQFVDESALPDWLRAQGAAPTPSGAIPPASPMSPMSSAAMPGAMPGAAPMPAAASEAHAFPAYVPSAPAGTPDVRPGMSFSASDLIDPDLLPQWVRGDNGKGAGNGPPQQATFSSSAGWTSKGPAVPGSGILPPPPPPPAPASARSWQRSGASDQLPALQDHTAVGSASGRPYSEPPSGFGPFGEDGARSGGGRRSGGGIPAGELPPWLQQAEPARAPSPAMGAGGQRLPDAGGWAPAPQRQEADAWNDGYAAGEADFAWDDNQYANDQAGYDEQGAGYDQNAYDPNAYDGYDQGGYDQGGYDQGGYDTNGYDQGGYDQNAYDPNAYDSYEYDAPPEADERSGGGGWRRLFGR